MIIGLESIKKHPACGIPDSHLQAIIDTSQHHHAIVGIRAVSPMAKHWIEQGYPSKSFNIKNKTSRSGPSQGLIVMDPNMSRLSEASSPITVASLLRSGSDDSEQVKQNSSAQSLKEAYQKQLTYALEHDDSLRPIPLVLTREDLDVLQDMYIQPEPPDFVLTWYDGEGYLRVAKAKFNAEENNYAILNEDDQAMMVLGKEVINAQGQSVIIPITADYDLLVVCPTYQDFSPGKGHKDHTPLRTQSFSASSDDFKKNINLELQRPDSPKEDPKGGNWSERIHGVVDTLNEKIALSDTSHRGQSAEGLEMAHHNAEFTNPFASPLKSSLPAIIFLPKPMDLGRAGVLTDCVMVETKEELNEIRNYLQTQGYYWPANVNLKHDVPIFPEEKLTQLNEHIQKQLKKELQTLKESSTPENQNTSDTHNKSDPKTSPNQ